VSLKTTAILSAALIALCVGYWLMLKLEETGRQEAIEAKRVFTFGPGDLKALEVLRLGEQPSAAVRQGDGTWSITAPHDTIEANQTVWRRVARALAGLSNDRTIDPAPKDLAGYGLDEPVLTVAGETVDGSRVKVAFGLMEPTQLNRYAQLLEGGNNGVFLAANKAFRELDRPLLDLRRRYLVTVGESGITRLEFALFWQGRAEEASKAEAKGLEIGQESAMVAVERSGEGSWRMVEPFDALAKQELINDLVKEVQFAVGRDYVDAPESLADYGLHPPAARITVVSGGGPRQTILFGALDETSDRGGLFVKRASNPSVFVMDSHIVTLFPKSLDSFRENRLLTRRASDIERIHYRTAETDVVLEKDPEQGWSITQPAGGDTDQVTVSSFVAAVKALAGIDFPEEAPGEGRAQFGLDKPAVDMSLSFAGEDEPAQILVGAMRPEKDAYFATQDTGVIVAVPIPMIEDIMWTVFDFRSRRLMQFAGASAVRVTLYFEGVDYLFEKVHGRWLVRAPADHGLERQSDMDILLDAVNPVHATAVEAERAPADLEVYGLDHPLCTIAVTDALDLPPGEQTVHGPLKIGNIAQDDSRQRFAIIRGHPEVFRVKQGIIDDLREALRGVRKQ